MTSTSWIYSPLKEDSLNLVIKGENLTLDKYYKEY